MGTKYGRTEMQECNGLEMGTKCGRTEMQQCTGMEMGTKYGQPKINSESSGNELDW